MTHHRNNDNTARNNVDIAKEFKRDHSTLVISRNRVVYCRELSEDHQEETKSQIFSSHKRLPISSTYENYCETKYDDVNSTESKPMIESRRNGDSIYHGVSITTEDEYVGKIETERNVNDSGSNKWSRVVSNLNQTIQGIDGVREVREPAVLRDADYLNGILELLKMHVSSFEMEAKSEEDFKRSDHDHHLPIEDLASVENVGIFIPNLYFVFVSLFFFSPRG